MICFELNKGGSAIRIEGILKKLGRIVSREFKKNGVISIALVGSAKIKEYNQRYRKKKNSTDILTFVLNPVRSPLHHRRGGNRLEKFTSNGVNEKDCLGEIILSPVEIKKRAKKSGETIIKTTTDLIVHGICHIFDFTHKSKNNRKKMERKEKEILNKL